MGSYDANSLGLYDIRGNVYEWCRNKNGSIACRGGGFRTGSAKTRREHRRPQSPGAWQDTIGVRPVFNVLDRPPVLSEVAGNFGHQAASSEDVAVIAAPWRHSRSGSAFVFHRRGDLWSQPVELRAPHPMADDEFGGAVATDGETILVGSTYANGNLGAVYAFRQTEGHWLLEEVLHAPSPSTTDSFGSRMAVTGSHVLIAAHADDSPLPGDVAVPEFSKSQGDSDSHDSGAVYAYRYNESAATWRHSQTLRPITTQKMGYFGSALACDRELAVVGALRYRGKVDESGEAHVFRWDQTAEEWKRDAILKAPGDEIEGLRFGATVAVRAPWIVVGAKFVKRNGRETGAAFLYEYVDGEWTEGRELVARNLKAGSLFSSSISIRGDSVALGAHGDEAAYLFRLVDGDWVESQKIESPRQGRNNFAHSLTWCGQELLITSTRRQGRWTTGEAFLYSLGKD